MGGRTAAVYLRAATAKATCKHVSNGLRERLEGSAAKQESAREIAARLATLDADSKAKAAAVTHNNNEIRHQKVEVAASKSRAHCCGGRRQPTHRPGRRQPSVAQPAPEAEMKPADAEPEPEPEPEPKPAVKQLPPRPAPSSPKVTS